MSGYENEIWRDSPSLPEYRVSDMGRVMRIPHEKPMPNGRGVRVYGGKPWIGTWSGTRYIFRFGGKNYKVARLVCEAFHGPAPEGAPNVLHIDENSRNNFASNLEWGSQKKNLNAPGFIAYCRSRTGHNNPYTKGKRARILARANANSKSGGMSR